MESVLPGQCERCVSNLDNIGGEKGLPAHICGQLASFNVGSVQPVAKNRPLPFRGSAAMHSPSVRHVSARASPSLLSLPRLQHVEYDEPEALALQGWKVLSVAGRPFGK